MGGESERTILPVARRKLDPLVERLKKDEAIELLWEGDQVREGESRMVAGLRLITCQHFLEGFRTQEGKYSSGEQELHPLGGGRFFFSCLPYG